MTPTEKRQRLRAVLAGDVCVSPATVYDALSARVAQSAGHQVGVLSGSVSGNTVLAVPDLMLQTLTEFAEQVRRITRASDLSLVLDADNGYGNALNVMRTVQELEHAGTSALMVEDVVMPQRFGAASLEVVSTEEMVGKLRAAVSARQDPSLILFARTAALKAEDVQRTAARTRAYAATGVDGIFLTGVTRLDEFDAIRAAVSIPIVLGTTPGVKREDLAARGVRLVLQGHQPVAAVVKTLLEVYTHLQKGGAPADLKSKVASAEEMASVMRHAQYDAWSRDFLR
jgi:oxaloacetate decarboxylase